MSIIERSRKFTDSFGLSRCALTGLVALSLLAGASSAAQAQRVELSDTAKKQIETLMEEKAARTPAQQKINSQLLYEMKRRRGDPAMRAVPTLRSSIEVARDGTTLVDMKAEVSDALLDRIEALGGRVVNHQARFKAVRARMPVDQLEALAQSPDVISIRPADRAITNKINTSEGDVAHRANVARADFGVDGTGAKICALSDGVASLGSLQGSGDLPAVAVLPGQAGSGSEGTAMLEIIFDLAPGAALGFATAFGGQAGFAQNILDLRADDCDVIVDDVFYFAEPVFQDGIIAQAVEEVTADGAIYFSSAGNAGNLNDGTSGVWEGDFSSIAPPPALAGMDTHDFGGTPLNTITADPPFAITLQWSDPFGASSNDYDLYLLNAAGTLVLAASNSIQDGNDDPFEGIDSGPFNDTGLQLVVVRTAGAAARYLHMNTIRGRLEFATDGQTSGHSATENVFGVAAVNVASAGGGAFDGTEVVETFSSDGPRQVFYEADGTPITPGNFLEGGGAVRQKPDVTAADGVATATPGFNPFFGTSAAAPHAAAIAGLLVSVNPNLNEDDIRQIFADSALDIEAPGPDRDSGVGILDAVAALDELTTGALLGETTIDGAWRTVSVPSAFLDPVVIVGPPTFNDPEPGVVRLDTITASSFDVRFQEWTNLDGVHGSESVPYLISDPSGEVLPDGSVVEIGRFSLGGTGSFLTQSFTQPFPAPPALFLTIQTLNGGDPVTVRARNVTAGGFEAALFKEEALMSGGHPSEQVGFLALYSPSGSGEVDVGGQDVPFAVQSPRIDERFAPVLSSTLKLEEDTSAGPEVTHIKERLSVLALGNTLFAQDVSSRGRDTVALRRLVPSFPAPVEWGTVEGITGNWTTVPTFREYTDPVVVARPVSSRGEDPGVIRLQNVTAGSFELRYQEWDYLDGSHGPERVFYMVAEAGSTSVAGLTVEAGTLDTSRLLRGGLDPVAFTSSFVDAPALLTSVQTSNGGDPVTTRVAALNAVGFGIAMSEEEAKTDGHAIETLSWIAVERGSGMTTDGRAVSVFNDSASSQPRQVPFGQTFDRLFPVFVGDISTTRGVDPVFLRYRSLTPSSVQLFLDEEESFDAETTHTSETISIFLAE
ncbi:MAG: S8 family serine peptidase [Kiloniellales bacterium]|nr:S8 family serine peptidase [Kiloniellales bacterium]